MFQCPYEGQNVILSVFVRLCTCCLNIALQTYFSARLGHFYSSLQSLIETHLKHSNFILYLLSSSHSALSYVVHRSKTFNEVYVVLNLTQKSSQSPRAFFSFSVEAVTRQSPFWASPIEILSTHHLNINLRYLPYLSRLTARLSRID